MCPPIQLVLHSFPRRFMNRSVPDSMRISTVFSGAKIAALAAMLLASPVTIAQTQTFTVAPNNNATALAQSIVGTGVTLVGTPTLVGAPSQAGTFQNFSTGPFTNPVTQA